MNEICKEHVDNNFRPLPKPYVEDFEVIRTMVMTLFNDTLTTMDTNQLEVIPTLRRHGDDIKDAIAKLYYKLYDHLHEGDASAMTVLYVYLNMLQETQEMVSMLRKYLRAYLKLHGGNMIGGKFGATHEFVAI